MEINISIVIITKNEEKNIQDCLNSLNKLKYSKGSYEVIVVDSSTDNTAKLVSGFASVKLLLCETASFAKQRNLGIKQASYPWIAFIDADCLAPADWLETLVSALEQDSKTAAIAGNAYPPENSSHTGKMIACLGFPAGGAIGLDAIKKVKNGGIDSASTCNALFSKDILNDVGLFDEKMRLGEEDTELCRRITSAGYLIKYNPRSFVYHKTRDSLAEFISWSFRRGRANQNNKKAGLLRLFFLPVIASGALVAVIFIGFYSINLFMALAVVSYSALITSMFVFGNKFKLLFKRRKKIGVNFLNIFVEVPLLFLIRRFVINLGQLKEYFNAT